MQRLCERQDTPSAEEELLSRLVRQTAPAQSASGQKDRIREAIRAGTPSSAGAGYQLKPAVLCGGVALVGAASIVLGGWLLRPTPVPPLLEAPRVIELLEPLAVPGPSIEAPTPISPPIQKLEPRRRTARVPAVQPEAESEGSALMVAAVRALRRANNPQEASALSEKYLSRFPEGPLNEEAHALRVEAADSAGSPDAGELARDYLRRFPMGNFRSSVEAILRKNSPD